MWPNPQKTADLVTFTEEIHNGKLHFLCNADHSKQIWGNLYVCVFCATEWEKVTKIPLLLINDIFKNSAPFAPFYLKEKVECIWHFANFVLVIIYAIFVLVMFFTALYSYTLWGYLLSVTETKRLPKRLPNLIMVLSSVF